MIRAHDPRHTQGGGYPPGGYGGPPSSGYPPGAPAGGYGPPAGPPGGYGPPGAPYGAPLPPPGGGSPFGPPGGSPNPGLKKQAQTWLIVSAVSMFFCTSCLGLAGAVFCYMAMQAADQGNIADAENKLKWGKILTLIGLVIGVLLTVASIAYYFLKFAGSFVKS